METTGDRGSDSKDVQVLEHLIRHFMKTYYVVGSVPIYTTEKAPMVAKYELRHSNVPRC